MACGNASGDDIVEHPVTLILPKNTDLGHGSIVTFYLWREEYDNKNAQSQDGENPKLHEWQTSMSGTKIQKVQFDFPMPRDLLILDNKYLISAIIRDNTKNNPQNLIGRKQITYGQFVSQNNLEIPMTFFAEPSSEDTAIRSFLMNKWYIDGTNERSDLFPSQVYFSLNGTFGSDLVCNRIEGQYDRKGTKIAFTNIRLEEFEHTSHSNCTTETNLLENDFFSVLANVKEFAYYKLENGGVLIFLTTDSTSVSLRHWSD